MKRGDPVEIKKEEHNIKMNARKGVFRSKKSLFHWHHNFEICQILENEMDVCVNGVMVHAKEGDLIAIGESVVHQFLATHEAAYLRVMQFSLKVLMESGIPIIKCKVHITREEQDQIPGLRQNINFLLDAIEEEKRTDHGENNYFQQCMVSALYCLLTRHFPSQANEDLTKDQKEFLRILEYIGEHFEENINVSVLAERLFMYRGTVSSLFARHAGMSLNEYIYSLRIKKANAMMAQGRSITEAALSSGFQSVRTFNNTYKKITGITPTEYRKKKMEKM